MTQRLKRWESPRRQGRNGKGKGGSARARQLKKQTQMLRKKLQEGQNADDQTTRIINRISQGKKNSFSSLIFLDKSPKTGLTHL